MRKCSRCDGSRMLGGRHCLGGADVHRSGDHHTEALISNGGCTIQDKVFTFDSGSYTGGGAITPAEINAGVVFNNGPGTDLHGWIFQPTVNWDTGFALSYSIAVAPGFPNVSLVGTKLQINSGFSSGVSAMATQNGGALPAAERHFGIRIAVCSLRSRIVGEYSKPGNDSVRQRPGEP